jgi:hypothetical protein
MAPRANVAASAEDGFSAGHPAPGVNASNGHVVVRIDLFADRGIDALARDHCIGASDSERSASRGLRECDGRSFLVLVDPLASMVSV